MGDVWGLRNRMGELSKVCNGPGELEIMEPTAGLKSLKRLTFGMCKAGWEALGN